MANIDPVLEDYAKLDPLWAQVAAGMRAANFDYEILMKDREAARLGIYQRMREAADKICPVSGMTINETAIEIGDNKLPAIFYIPEANPENPSEKFPVFFMLQGGAHIVCFKENQEIDGRVLCKKFRAICLVIEFGNAPEVPWPAPQNNVIATCKWIVDNIHKYNGDINKGLLLYANSAGATLAAIATQHARNDPSLKGKITGVLYSFPQLYKLLAPKPEKYKHLLISFDQCSDEPMRVSNLWPLAEKYHKTGPAEDPEVSPLMVESFAELPPSVFVVGGADSLRDEGLVYEKMLSEAGIPTKLVVYKGYGHGFPWMVPELPASKQYWEKDLFESIEWLLEFAPGRK